MSELNKTNELMQALKQFSTAEISDALDACGIEGALLHIKPLSDGMKLAGPAYTVQFAPYKEKPSAFQKAANYIDAIPPHSVVVIDNNGLEDCTVWGAILTEMAELKSLAGTVVYGAVRDVDYIRAAKYPVFCKSIYMRSGRNRIKKIDEQCTLQFDSISIIPGDIIFGDDNGVLVIPKNILPEILNKARNIQLTENKILQAIRVGSSLEQARITYRYDQAWLGESE